MEIRPFFFKIYLAGPDSQFLQFLGTAFPVAPNGGLVTCRHVVDVNLKDDEFVVVHDEELNRVVAIEECRYPKHSSIDIAFIPNALKREKREFFPILSPESIVMGMDVYSFGYFDADGGHQPWLL